ncbi:MAG: hypothetical protein LBF97_01580 [Elusimicrobiota bacterium]|nr:hypothetical protein [Elusimicrobiota bacterium]
MAIILEALVFLVDLSFSLITDHIHFSTDFNILLQKYSQIWTPKKIDVFKKFASDFSVQFFWMLNVFVGIIVGVSSSAIFFWLEFIAWFGFLWNELKYMSFWEKSLYMGFFRGIIYAPFTFVGYFGKSKNYILLAFVILAFYVLITPILAMIYKKTKSIIYPSIFNGIIFSTSVLSTFFIVGADELIIGFYGLAGIFVLLTANVVLYYFYIKNFRIISKK